MAKRTKKEPEKLKIELYMSKTYTGYSGYYKMICIMANNGSVVSSCLDWAPRSIVHEVSRYFPEGGEVELHCDGNETEISHELDGYWGRPKIIVRDTFLRRLRRKEREELQKRLEKETRGTGLVFHLVA